MFILDGKTLQVGVPFTHNDVQYPANWLQLASAADKTALGITETADPVRPDDTYYYVTQNADGSFTSTPKDLAGLKAAAANQVRETVWQMLTKTDYMDSRKINDASYTPPAAWVAWRAKVRTTMTAAVAAINAATDINSLIAAKNIAWPLDPDAAAATASTSTTTATPSP